MMACFMCKGSVRNGLSVFTADLGGCIVVIKNVPSDVCGQCGEASYSNDVARRLEQIVQNITHSAAAEIAVVSYSEKAA
jgi:YgiT-type zinc finger domain-containing protein